MNRYIKIIAAIVAVIVFAAGIIAVFNVMKKPVSENISVITSENETASKTTEKENFLDNASEIASETLETVTAASPLEEVLPEAETPDGNSYVTDFEPPVTTRTVITSRQRKEYDNNSVYIDMENILQNPELPVGCEITSLTILLRHCGFNAEKTDLARNYLPIGKHFKSENGKNYKDSFFNYFIGDPFSRGYGCFSGAIQTAAVNYISANGGGYDVVNLSGSGADTLYDYVANGTPVLCWATDGMIEPEYYETWYDYETGEKLDWYLNEHCVVLVGFNMSAGTVTLNDPMKGIIDYNIDRFETRYKQMHSQAIVILPQKSETETAAETTAEETTAETNTENISETETETIEISEITSESQP